MIKKIWTVLTFALLATMVLAACSPAATATVAAPAATEKPAEVVPTEAPVVAAEPVTIAFWEQEGDDVDVFIDTLVAEFMAANPDIIVERTHYENEALRDQFQTASLAESAPEVVRVPNDFAGPFSVLQIIAPMTDLFDQAFLDQFYEGDLGLSLIHI